ncbi:MAG: hypothetical protein ACRDMH_03290 [Solirubrobacterales bacterium]
MTEFSVPEHAPHDGMRFRESIKPVLELVREGEERYLPIAALKRFRGKLYRLWEFIEALPADGHYVAALQRLQRERGAGGEQFVLGSAQHQTFKWLADSRQLSDPEPAEIAQELIIAGIRDLAASDNERASLNIRAVEERAEESARLSIESARQEFQQREDALQRENADLAERARLAEIDAKHYAALSNGATVEAGKSAADSNGAKSAPTVGQKPEPPAESQAAEKPEAAEAKSPAKPGGKRKRSPNQETASLAPDEVPTP